MINASRPKVVEYQGVPAYGYGPSSVFVVSNRMSARDFLRTESSSGLETSILVVPISARRIDRCASRKPFR